MLTQCVLLRYLIIHTAVLSPSLPHTHLVGTCVYGAVCLVLLAGWRWLDVCAGVVVCFCPAYRARRTVVQEWGGIPSVPMYSGVLLGILGWYALCVYLLGCALGDILCAHALHNCGDNTYTLQTRDVKDVVVHADRGGDL